MRRLLVVCLLAQVLVACGMLPTQLAPAGSQAAPPTRQSVTYGVLYSFQGHFTRDGGFSYTALINVNGTLYGTTNGTQRGPGHNGTVFTITASGDEKELFLFKNGQKHGANPNDLINVGSTLYGTTTWGGSSDRGTVFSVTSAGREKVLHNFVGTSSDGADPSGLVNVNGTLYGTTASGGTGTCNGYTLPGCGTVFTMTSSGAETVLYNFKGGTTDGGRPAAPLTEVQGTLYGTTAGGGSSGDGTVFAITPSGTETVLYNFKGGTRDGAHPELAPLVDVDGTLYGTTWAGGSRHCGREGCGTVFAVTPSGKERVVYIFQAGPADGAFPDAPVVDVGGTLYGTTEEGGADSSGTVFAITASGTETILHSFAGTTTDGRYPVAGLLNVGGTLYGTTVEGGSYGAGTVFTLTP